MPGVEEVAAHMALDPVALGRHLKGARADAGFTAQRLASEMKQRYGSAAPSSVTIGRYEAGRTPIPLDTFVTAMLILRTPSPARRIAPAIKGASDRDLWKLLIEA